MKKSSKNKFFYALVGFLAINAAHAQTIRCVTTGQEDVVISINAKKAFNQKLNCISGPFVYDMTPCAPSGGYGLSAPTGSAPLVDIVYRWQDYHDHSGAIVGHFIKAEEIVFSGHFKSGEDGIKDLWTFIANRFTGEAKLMILDSDIKDFAKSAKYKCSKSSTRF
jgi:hypothetical protein